MKNVNWTKWSAVAEILSAIAIVGTLLYLSVQTRQNTDALLALSRQASLQAELDFTTDWIDHPKVMDSKLSDEEERYIAWRIKALRIREFEWIQYRAGILDEATWQSYMAPMRGIFSGERARAVLDGYAGSPEFKAYLIHWMEEGADP